MQSADLASIVQLVRTEEHALAMNDRLRLMTSAAARAASKAADRDAASLRALAARLALGTTKVTLNHGTVISERIEKTFALSHPTDASALLFTFEWSLERSLIPQAMDAAFSGAIHVKTVTPAAASTRAEFQSNLERLLSNDASAALVTSAPRALVELTDTSSHLYADEWAAVQAQLIAGADIRPSDLGWFLSFACTFPTDYAFDEISRAFMPENA
jgi:hypothetical protein